eukprot:1146449-Pelagomonas_calceolata.AAC.4
MMHCAFPSCNEGTALWHYITALYVALHCGIISLHCEGHTGLQGKKRPQSRRLTASLCEARSCNGGAI